MAQHLRIATAASVTRSLGDFAETETVRDIHRSLELIRSMNGAAMTMIAGVPGVGKTTAVKSFCRQLGHDAIYIKAAVGEGTAWNLATTIMEGFHASNSFNTLSQAHKLVGQYFGQNRFIVVDEAQHLIQRNRRNNITGEAFGWLVDVAEDAGFDLVFCGDLTLPDFVKSTPRMNSRMRRPILIRGVTERDVGAVVSDTGFETPECIRALQAISRLSGGLRNVENVVRIASSFAGSDEPGPEHLRAAIIDMKLDQRGVAR
jgi:DNA transposition AAA+ family ATPase